MNLKEFFGKYPQVIVAYSGGIDSTYLLYAARQYAQNVQAIMVKTAFQPEFEVRDAKAFCKKHGLALEVLEYDIWPHEEITANHKNRCYYCKKALFSAIGCRAKSYPGYALLDGSNADDNEDERPGMQALREFGVLSPLKLCGFTKAMIRQAAKENGLSLWDKPAYACLATRIAHGEPITAEKLKITAYAEERLKELGFHDVRVRYNAGVAKIQLVAKDFPRFIASRPAILAALSGYYKAVTLDLEARNEK